MDDAVVVALVAVLTLVVLDALVVAGLVLARKVADARAARERRTTPGLATVLHTLPDGHDPARAISALIDAGHAVLVDPEHPRTLLVSRARVGSHPSHTPRSGWP